MIKRAMWVFVYKRRIKVQEHTGILATSLYSHTTSNFPFLELLELLL